MTSSIQTPVLFPVLWQDRPPSLHDACLLIQERIFASLPPSYSQLNKTWYQAIKGKAFVFSGIRGKEGAYLILKSIHHKEAAAILTQTGLEIHIPQGQAQQEDFKLGEGSYGIVRVGYSLRHKHYVAIKTPKEGLQIEQETRIQADLGGLPHIMKLLDTAVVFDPLREQNTLYQIMPLAGLGSLKNTLTKLRTLDPDFRQRVIFTLIQDLFTAASAMHDKGYCHLDLKADNVVLTQQGEWQLIDYGCAEKMDEGLIHVQEANGTLSTLSPERWLHRNKNPDLCNGEKIDCWAMGCILLEIEGNELPFNPVEIRHIMDHEGEEPSEEPSGYSNHPSSGYIPISAKYHSVDIDATEGRLAHYFSTQLKVLFLQVPPQDSFLSFIHSLLNLDPQQRPTLFAAQQHPWFVTMQQEDSYPVRGYLKECVQEMYREERLKNQPSALSPQSLPFAHFSHYVERKELQAQLLQSLLTLPMTIVQGMGGMGKTQLMTYLLHQPEVKRHFHTILWFRSSDTPDMLAIQHLTLARELGLVDEKASEEKALSALHTYFARQSCPTLIVYDNADAPDILTPYLPPRGCHLVATTRSTTWASGHLLPITSLSQEEGLALIHRLLQHEDPTALTLCQVFEGLPLAIAQACAYIRAQQLSLPTFLTQLEQSPALLEKEEQLFGKALPRTVMQLWNITFNTLEKTCPEALQLLNALSFLSPDLIPSALLDTLAEEATQQALIDNALLFPHSGGASVHRLIQTVRRFKLIPAAAESALIHVMQEMGQLYDMKGKAVTARELNKQLLSHGESVIEQAKKRESTSEQLNKEWVDTLLWLADLQETQGRPLQNQELCEQALTLANQTFKEEDPEIATCLNNLGKSLCALGKADEALSYFRRSLSITEKVYGNDHPEVAIRLNNLGYALHALGKVGEVLPYFQCALSITEKVYGNDHPDVATPLNNLGLALQDLGKADEAFLHFRRALSITEKVYGNDHPDVARNLNNLGLALHALGKADEAFLHLQRALSIYEKVYGNEHPDTITLRETLENVLEWDF